MQICKICNTEKEEKEFRKVNNYLKKVCRKCECEKQKSYYHNPQNRQKRIDSNKRYRLDNKEKIKEYQTMYNRTRRGRSNKIVNKKINNNNENIFEETIQKKVKSKNKKCKEIVYKKMSKKQIEQNKKRILEFFKNKRME